MDSESGLVSLDELPSMPAASVRIVGLCDNPDVDIRLLAEAISIDPALSARILRLANSAAFNRGREATTVERSMMLMGIKAAKLTALGFVVSSALSDAPNTSPETMSAVWRDCLVEAVACRQLAALANLRCGPEAFLAGMFDGMGKLLGVLTRPETYGELIASNHWPDAADERGCLGVSRGELVQAALRSWGVPDLYAAVLQAADEEADTYDQSEVSRLAAIVVLARQATHLLTGHGEESEQAEIARVALDLDGDAVDQIAVDLGGHVSDLANALDVDLGGAVDFQELLNQARNQIVETSMAMAEESIQQTDHISSLEGQRAALEHEATTDRLTGLPNRARFDDELAKVIADRVEGRTISGALGVAMIDIDHFKSFNDTHGHRAGDDVLAAVGETLRRTTREGEMIARYGGEEFVMLLPIIESEHVFSLAVERIRAEIAGLSVDVGGLLLGLTVSMGGVAATSFASLDGGTALVEAADRLLYKAKHAGRNCCRVQFLNTGTVESVG